MKHTLFFLTIFLLNSTVSMAMRSSSPSRPAKKDDTLLNTLSGGPAIIAAIHLHSPENLKKGLDSLGESRWTPKNSVEVEPQLTLGDPGYESSGYESYRCVPFKIPLIHLLYDAWNVPKDDPKHDEKMESNGINLHLLLDHGFQIPLEEPDNREYFCRPALSEEIVCNPYIFGAVLRALERAQKKSAPSASTHRNMRSLTHISDSIILRLSADEEKERVLEDHCKSALQFHTMRIHGVKDKPRVKEWPADITLDEVKERMRIPVLSAYDRLVKELK